MSSSTFDTLDEKPLATLTLRLVDEVAAMMRVAEVLKGLGDDAKARRVIGAVAVLEGFADIVWKEKPWAASSNT